MGAPKGIDGGFTGSVFFPSGCLGKKAAGRESGREPRTSSRHLKKLAAGDPNADVRVRKIKREGRHWLADVTVESNGSTVRKWVLIDKYGRIIEERP